jgi:hypothetical protein
MNLPLEINQRVLNELASPADSTTIRVICTSAPNGSAYRLRGKRRQYVFERDNTVGAHVLDVPASLWQHDVPTGPYRENLSICHDIQTVIGVKVPLVFMIIPRSPTKSDETPTVGSLDAGTVILGYFNHIEAPEHVVDEVRKIAASPREFLHYLADPADVDKTADEPSSTGAAAKTLSMDPAAIRMREMRKRKREEKATKKPRVTRQPQTV